MFYFSKTISKMIYAIYKWEPIFSIHIFFFCPKYVYESEEEKSLHKHEIYRIKFVIKTIKGT